MFYPGHPSPSIFEPRLGQPQISTGTEITRHTYSIVLCAARALITASGSLGFALSVPLDLRGPRTDAGVTLITRGQVHGFAGHVNASLSRTQDPDPARIPMKSKFHQRLTSAAWCNLRNYNVSLTAVKILQIQIARVNANFRTFENVEIDNILRFRIVRHVMSLFHVSALFVKIGLLKVSIFNKNINYIRLIFIIINN